MWIREWRKNGRGKEKQVNDYLLVFQIHRKWMETVHVLHTGAGRTDLRSVLMDNNPSVVRTRSWEFTEGRQELGNVKCRRAAPAPFPNCLNLHKITFTGH